MVEHVYGYYESFEHKKVKLVAIKMMLMFGGKT